MQKTIDRGPKKAKHKSINVELAPSIHGRLKKAAETERRSLRKQIAVFLEEAAERFEREEASRA